MFIYSMGLAALSLYIISPFYSSATGSSFSTFDGERLLEIIIAVGFLLAAVPGIITLFLKEEKRLPWLKRSTFGIFLSFFFLFILRIAVAGWTPWIWIYPLIISLSSGMNRLFLEVREE